jgi:hypothetical protein
MPACAIHMHTAPCMRSCMHASPCHPNALPTVPRTSRTHKHPAPTMSPPHCSPHTPTRPRPLSCLHAPYTCTLRHACGAACMHHHYKFMTQGLHNAVRLTCNGSQQRSQIDARSQLLCWPGLTTVGLRSVALRLYSNQLTGYKPGGPSAATADHWTATQACRLPTQLTTGLPEHRFQRA